MWPFKRKSRLTVEEYVCIFETIAEKVTALNEEARLMHMVEVGLLPQSHLSREDLLKHRSELDEAGRTRPGKPDTGGAFNTDPDLTARDD